MEAIICKRIRIFHWPQDCLKTLCSVHMAYQHFGNKPAHGLNSMSDPVARDMHRALR